MTIHCLHCPDYDPDNMYDPANKTSRKLRRGDSNASKNRENCSAIRSRQARRQLGYNQLQLAVLLTVRNSPIANLT